MTARHSYRLFGLLVQSELLLPEILTVESGEPDVTFRFAGVAACGLEGGKPLGPFHSAAPGKLWLHVPDIARFLVLDGKEVWIEPMQGIDEDSLRVFLLGACMGALLMQRGLLVLRGCAVRVGGGSLLCLGGAEAGKSALAIELMRRGYAILSDDVVAIDSENRSIPGFPDLKLWQDAAVKFGIPLEGLRRTRPGIEKFHVALGPLFHDAPLPTQSVYVLSPHNQNEFRLESITGMKRFDCLHEYSYRPLYSYGMGLHTRHLQNCAAFSRNVSLQYLHRPRYPWRMEELADLILDDMETRA